MVKWNKNGIFGAITVFFLSAALYISEADSAFLMLLSGVAYTTGYALGQNNPKSK